MTASLSESTLNQYKSTIKLWGQFCETKGIDFCYANSYQLLEFLTEKFNSNASYSTLNSYRSALSLLLGNNTTTDDCVKRFLKGVYRLRPPAPKYQNTWDPTTVLTFLNQSPNESLSLKDLSHKTITLLALASAQRIQTLSLIKIKNIIFETEKLIIKIEDLIKTSKPGLSSPLIVLPFIKENPNICPAITIKHYINKISTLPSSEYLFISYQNPHKKVGSQTLAHWVKAVLHKSGVDITKYGAHSTRHASTSAAHRAGVNLEVIRKAAGWAQSSNVFSKYYHKNLPALAVDTDFAEAIFNSK